MCLCLGLDLKRIPHCVTWTLVVVLNQTMVWVQKLVRTIVSVLMTLLALLLALVLVLVLVLVAGVGSGTAGAGAGAGANGGVEACSGGVASSFACAGLW